MTQGRQLFDDTTVRLYGNDESREKDPAVNDIVSVLVTPLTHEGRGHRDQAETRWKRFVRELRSRRVFRVAGAYVVSAWLSVQVMDIVCDTFALPAWVLRWYLVAAVLGFPVFIALAWFFQLTSLGIEIHDRIDPVRATEPPGRIVDLVVISILVIVMVLMVLAWDTPSPPDAGSAMFDAVGIR